MFGVDRGVCGRLSGVAYDSSCFVLFRSCHSWRSKIHPWWSCNRCISCIGVNLSCFLDQMLSHIVSLILLLFKLFQQVFSSSQQLGKVVAGVVVVAADQLARRFLERQDRLFLDHFGNVWNRFDANRDVNRGVR